MCSLFQTTAKRRQREALERARQRKAQSKKVKASTPVYDWHEHNIDVKGEK
jgi:hypothetical protein